MSLGALITGRKKMKNAVAILFRFAKKTSEKPDAFDQRLTVMTKSKTPRPTRATPPSLFRQGSVRAA